MRLLWAVCCRLRGLLSLATALLERAEPPLLRKLRLTEFQCQYAGYPSPKRCSGLPCGPWGAMDEENFVKDDGQPPLVSPLPPSPGPPGALRFPEVQNPWVLGGGNVRLC